MRHLNDVGRYQSKKWQWIKIVAKAGILLFGPNGISLDLKSVDFCRTVDAVEYSSSMFEEKATALLPKVVHIPSHVLHEIKLATQSHSDDAALRGADLHYSTCRRPKGTVSN
ncbi:unnamed protein product [Absidia cylindrospora]